MEQVLKSFCARFPVYFTLRRNPQKESSALPVFPTPILGEVGSLFFLLGTGFEAINLNRKPQTNLTYDIENNLFLRLGKSSSNNDILRSFICV